MKNLFKLFAFLLAVFFLFTSFRPGQRDVDQMFGRDHNVCKKLKGNVLLYVVWVETRLSSTWSEFDLNSTVDSIKATVRWLNAEAAKNNVELHIRFDAALNDSIAAVYQKLGDEVPSLIDNDDGLARIDKWTTKIVKLKSGVKSKVQFVSELRDEYNVESVALVFMLNNYYKEDFIFSFNTTSNNDVEYSIISSKRPNLIAQDLLNLFGAPYLYHHPSTVNKRDTKQLQKIFSDDVMSNTDRPLNSLSLGEITKYFIGWTDTLNTEYEKMVKEKAKI